PLGAGVLERRPREQGRHVSPALLGRRVGAPDVEDVAAPLVDQDRFAPPEPCDEPPRSVLDAHLCHDHLSPSPLTWRVGRRTRMGMRCAACGAELIPGKKFCHACGTRIAAQCRRCGAALEPGFRFCPDCGLQLPGELHESPPPPAEDPLSRLSRRSLPAELAHKIRAARGVIEGERKQVTDLFRDLSRSTAIAGRLDPVDYHCLLDRYLSLAFREIFRYEGIVNQLAGDGIMALFGAPIAHEDAPQRAILAALRIVEALASFNQQLRTERGFALVARIGIHTGPVAAGTVGTD